MNIWKQPGEKQMSEGLNTFVNILLDFWMDMQCSYVSSPFSLPWLFFSCSTPSWISLLLSRSSLAKIWPLFIIMMDLLSVRMWKSFRRRLLSCSFTLLSTAAITSFTSRTASVRSSYSSSLSVFDMWQDGLDGTQSRHVILTSYLTS